MPTTHYRIEWREPTWTGPWQGTYRVASYEAAEEFIYEQQPKTQLDYRLVVVAEEYIQYRYVRPEAPVQPQEAK